MESDHYSITVVDIINIFDFIINVLDYVINFYQKSIDFNRNLDSSCTRCLNF